VSLRIRPLHCGTITQPKTFYMYWGGFKELISVPSFAWLIEGGSKNILVDTSFNHGLQYEENLRPAERTEEQRLDAKLSMAGLKPEDVDEVLYTNLHWDHVGNCDLFPKAHHIVWREEMRYSMAPLGMESLFYESPVPPANTHPKWLTTGIRLDPVEREVEVIPGVTYFPTPGMTIGGCSVKVETSDGVYVISNDVISLDESIETGMPHGYVFEHEDAIRSLDTIIRTASSPKHVLPGHAVRVLERETYP